MENKINNDDLAHVTEKLNEMRSIIKLLESFVAASNSEGEIESLYLATLYRISIEENSAIERSAIIFAGEDMKTIRFYAGVELLDPDHEHDESTPE